VLSGYERLVVSLLLLLGFGFLIVNIRSGIRFLRYLRLRRSAILTWPGAKPRLYTLQLFFPIVFAVVILVKLFVWRMPIVNVFGESMMLVYYGYAMPMGLQIGRGFYADGLWLENGFIRYAQIGRIAWREGPPLTLLVMPRARPVAWHVQVPDRYYGEARRLLRDRIATHDITLGEKSLDLGTHDQQEDV
jgi:hypothetical protein